MLKLGEEEGEEEGEEGKPGLAACQRSAAAAEAGQLIQV